VNDKPKRCLFGLFTYDQQTPLGSVNTSVNIDTTPATPVTPVIATHPVTPTSTAVFSSAECFSSTESFIRLLKRNPKTGGIDFSNRNLSVDERKKVVAVGTSKLMETDSAYPSRAAKLRLAQLLSEVSGLPSVVFFDPVSHRGYIAKKLENLRVKLSPSKRLYSWKKRKTVCEEESADVTNAVVCENSVEGCPRGMSGCSLCRGV
jgi:hypothetical protein